MLGSGEGKWEVCDFSEISSHAFANENCAGVKAKNFLSPQEIDRTVESILRIGLEYYEGDDKGGKVVNKGKLGPNFFRFKDDQSEYFRRTAIFEPIFKNKILSEVDIVSRVRAVCSSMFQKNPASQLIWEIQ